MSETKVKTATTRRKRTEPVEPVIELTRGIIAVDNGGFNTKIFSEDMEAPISIPSQKKYGHNRKKMTVDYPEGSHTYKIEWNDKTYFFGLLMRESRKKMTGFTNSKATDYFVLSLLQAVALYGYDINDVVTCVPYSRYSEEEIDAIRERLIKEHTLVINGIVHTFTIQDVLVVPETLTAFYALMPEGTVRWLDLGSRTVGKGTTINEDGFFEPIEDESGTIEKEGLDISGDRIDDFTEYVENLSEVLNRDWNEDDKIIAFGGGALIDELVEALEQVYPNIEIPEDPLHLQVRGMLEMGKASFVEEEEDDINE